MSPLLPGWSARTIASGLVLLLFSLAYALGAPATVAAASVDDAAPFVMAGFGGLFIVLGATRLGR